MKRFKPLILIALLGILLGCNNNQNVVEIGVIAPLTGSASSTKQYVMEGFNMAVKDLNSSQNDIKYNVVFEDCKSNAAEATNCFNRLKAKGVKYIVAFGGQFAMAVASMTDKQNMLYFTLADYNEDVLNQTDCGFRVFPSATNIAEVSAQFLHDSLKVAHVATITMNTVPCLLATEKFTEDMNAYGVDINYQDTYDMGASDFRNTINKMANKDIDAVFFNGFGISPSAFCSQLASFPQFDSLVVLGDVNFATKTFSDNNKNNKLRIFYADSEMKGEVALTYQKEQHSRMNSLTGCSYMMPYIINEALLSDKSKNDFVAQKNALRNHTINTPVGSISFDDKGSGEMKLKVFSIN